uniref:Serum response factor homolog n=1 Tax=Meloidogyne floridensis TaxID=298350 RepID=A0A915PEC6_9BILA
MTSLINNNNIPITITKQKLLNNQQPEEEVRKKRGAGSSNCILLPNGKKTKGRVKIKMEYIGNKLRRYTTFSKRKTGIMKKANELSTLTGTQVLLLVASETGHVYAFATKQIIDPMPTKTEFTFEPQTLGITTPITPQQQQQLNNPRKRKLVSDLFQINDSSSNNIPLIIPPNIPSNNNSNELKTFCDNKINKQKPTLDELLFSNPFSSSQSSPSHNYLEPAQTFVDSKQQLKTLKEALRAASENRERLMACSSNSSSTPSTTIPPSPFSNNLLLPSSSTTSPSNPSPINKRKHSSLQQQNKQFPPILYQMPQASCMAAVCSGVSTSSTPINCGNDSLFKEENNLTTNNSSTGNALQNLLTAGILPLANLTAQQRML